MADFDIFNVPVDMPKRRMEDYSYTIYGKPKFGKSQLASCFPDPLFFCFETGQNAIKARKLPVADWKQYISYIDMLWAGKRAGKEVPYRNFINDTSDVAWKYCVAYVCKKNGWADASEGEWGAGWRAIADEWFNQIDRLQKLGTVERPCRVINIVHDEDKEFKPKNKPKYNKVVPSLPKGGRAVIVDGVDFILYCDIENVDNGDGTFSDKRVIHLRDNGEYEAGSRLMYMPESIDYGNTPLEAFQNFKLAFEKAVVEEFGNEDGTPSETPATPPKQTRKTTKKEKEPEVAKEPEKVPEKTKEPELAETPNVKEPDVESSTPTTMNLVDLKTAIGGKLTAFHKAGIITPVQIVSLLEEYTGQKRASQIDDVDKANNLYNHLLTLG